MAQNDRGMCYGSLRAGRHCAAIRLCPHSQFVSDLMVANPPHPNLGVMAQSEKPVVAKSESDPVRQIALCGWFNCRRHTIFRGWNYHTSEIHLNSTNVSC